MRTLFVALLCLVASIPSGAQKVKREPLTDLQQDQIAEAGIDPVARVDLYVKFLNGYADTVKGLTKRAKTPARAHRLDEELQDFAALMDELGDNLDVYSQRKADIRKSLKGLNEGVMTWKGVLLDLHSEAGFELSLKEALDSSNDLVDQARQITADQNTYFEAHKDEKGQDRAEPK
jgi:hypothetical protein